MWGLNSTRAAYFEEDSSACRAQQTTLRLSSAAGPELAGAGHGLRGRN